MLIDPQSILSRQDRLGQALVQSGFQALVINPGPSLSYLTGLMFHLMERPILAMFTVGDSPILIIPELEALKVASLPFLAQVYMYGEDPATWPSVFQHAAQACGLTGLVGVEPTKLRYLELKLLEMAAPGITITSAEDVLAGLRMRKDEHELQAMRMAVDISQTALQNLLPVIHPGITERQLAAELTLQLLRAGSDSETPFAPIVSAGPNSANPHAFPSDRPLSTGDLLVIDWGASYQGYCADLTRTFAIGPVEEEFEQIARIVEAANAAGRAAAGPGVQAGQVDGASRSVIEAAHYGAFFTHRTGHGLGMEGHEQPYIRPGNTLELSPGMTFTIEPGIYLPGRGGVRIEDDILITHNSAESLSTLPRTLIVLGK